MHLCDLLSIFSASTLGKSTDSASGAHRGKLMRDVTEVLRAKEQELAKVKREVEALRVALPLLGVEEDPLIPLTAVCIKSSSHLS
jgi:hypothetical protein